MKRTTLTAATALAIAAALGGGQSLAASSEIVPQLVDVPRVPGGGGGSGGGGPPAKGDLYGDLYIIDRDENGVPILYLWEDVDADGQLEPVQDDTGFANPITKGIIDPAELGLDWEQCYVAVVETGCLIPLNEEGEVAESDGFLLQEVEFGRLNIGRAPEKVLKKQLADVLGTLCDSESPLELDPAGRLMATIGGFETTVDSPLQNLALHQEIMEKAVLMGPTCGEILLPKPFPEAGFLDSAAPWLGVAGDKGGWIHTDLVVYLNAILKIPNDTNQPTILGPDGRLYFDYSGYSYNRQRAYPGCITYFLIEDGTATLIEDRSILNAALGTGEDVVADFGPDVGLYYRRLDDPAWQLLHALSPEFLATGDLDGNLMDEVVADFGTEVGLYYRRLNDPDWNRLHSLSPEFLATGDLDGNLKDEVVADFGADVGLYYRRLDDPIWKRLHKLSPEFLATGDLDGDGKAEVVADFGADIGLYYRRLDDPVWKQLHKLSPEFLATGDLDGDLKDDVVADFGADIGLYYRRLDDPIWKRLHKLSPEFLATGDLDGDGAAEVVADFGPDVGLYYRHVEDPVWKRLHSLSPEFLATGDLDGDGKAEVVADFGPDIGLYYRRMYDDVWKRLHSLSPEFLATGDLGGSMSYSSTNVAGFAQAADDARAVNAFVHDNVVLMADSMGSAELCH